MLENTGGTFRIDTATRSLHNLSVSMKWLLNRGRWGRSFAEILCLMTNRCLRQREQVDAYGLRIAKVVESARDGALRPPMDALRRTCVPGRRWYRSTRYSGRTRLDYYTAARKVADCKLAASSSYRVTIRSRPFGLNNIRWTDVAIPRRRPGHFCCAAQDQSTCRCRNNRCKPKRELPVRERDQNSLTVNAVDLRTTVPLET